MIFQRDGFGEVEVNDAFIFAATMNETSVTFTEWADVDVDTDLKTELGMLVQSINEKAERVKEIAFSLPQTSEGYQGEPG